MSKYDLLNASTELEQAITADLKAALEKRGCTVRHNGSATGHAAAGLPDIVVTHRNFVLTVEVTKSRGAQQDRE
ncbi:MAG: AlwI family type II restriction endonuclease, partial [Abitibacteriaceae bacterium]|nr:AlwI family type II restriction endonuclease [Abditibacteriaceae bacterium]